MSYCRYQLDCHCLIALYISTDSFKVGMRARIKSIAMRINHGIETNKYHVHVELSVEHLQMEKSTTRTIETGGKSGGRWMATCMRFQFSLKFSLRHTWHMCIGIVENACKNEGNNDLWHINEQEEIKDPFKFGLIPHCICTYTWRIIITVIWMHCSSLRKCNQWL